MLSNDWHFLTSAAASQLKPSGVGVAISFVVAALPMFPVLNTDNYRNYAPNQTG